MSEPSAVQAKVTKCVGLEVSDVSKQFGSMLTGFAV